jgi:catechol 2,3-dioxygenase-like lactoylglutathione lyase family enzyme
MPPAHEIAHLAHVELRPPVPEESLEFFTGYLGLTATGSAGDSVFLRAWDDDEQPGGNRIELRSTGARLVLAPDWQPVNRTEAERARGQAWGLKTIESFHTHGTPSVPES